MRIALVTVPQSSEARHIPERTPGFLPPLGLATLSAVLERDGHEVVILDSAVRGLGFLEIVDNLKRFNPHVVGLTFTTPQRHLSYALATCLKKNLPSAMLVAGGPHVTRSPEETLISSPAMHLVLVGECEHTFPSAIRVIERGEQPTGVPGVGFRSGKSVVINPQGRQDFDLDALPYPSRHLLQLDRYAAEPHESRHSPSTTLVATRGCSYSRCTFCLRSSPFKVTYKSQSVKRTIAEIEMLQHKHGIREIQFYDDDLFAHRAWIEEFSSELLEREIDISWFARCQPGAIAPEVLELAHRAGLYGLEIGFESGNQASLDLIKKGVTIEQSLAVGKWTRKLGIELAGNFILGLPGETPEMGRKTLSFAKRLDPTFAIFIPYHPEPGTPLYEVAEREGAILRSPYGEDSFHSRFIPAVSYVPSGYKDAEQLAALIRRAYLGFYLRPSKMLSYLLMARSRIWAGRFLHGLSYFVRVVR